MKRMGPAKQDTQLSPQTGVYQTQKKSLKKAIVLKDWDPNKKRKA